MTTTSLSDLDLDALVERLIVIAKEVRALTASANLGGVAALLDDVKVATRAASGERLAVLEVAEAYLRAMPHTSLGRIEQALRNFVREHDRLRLLAAAASPAGLDPATASPSDQAALDQLVQAGALRSLKDGRVDVTPSQRAFVRELLEPLAFRLWTRVQTARTDAAGHADPTTVLVEHLGVTAQQASHHLDAWPLTSVSQERSRDTLAVVGRVVKSWDRKWRHQVVDSLARVASQAEPVTASSSTQAGERSSLSAPVLH